MPAAASAQAPTGLLYRPDLIDPGEETELEGFVRDLDFRPVSMRGQTARRRVRLYGYDYDYAAGQVRPGGPLAPEFAGLRDRCAELARLRRQTEDSRLSYPLVLEPRSGYVPDGSARWAWEQSIPPTKALRHSVRFRTLHER